MGKKYFSSKSRPSGDGNRGLSVWDLESHKMKKNTRGTPPPKTARNDTLRVPERPRNSRRRRYCVTRAREWRDKPRHGHADGATGGSWCGLLTISGARLSGRRRRRQVRMYSKAAPGGGGGDTRTEQTAPLRQFMELQLAAGCPPRVRWRTHPNAAIPRK